MGMEGYQENNTKEEPLDLEVESLEMNEDRVTELISSADSVDELLQEVLPQLNNAVLEDGSMVDANDWIGRVIMVRAGQAGYNTITRNFGFREKVIELVVSEKVRRAKTFEALVDVANNHVPEIYSESAGAISPEQLIDILQAVKAHEVTSQSVPRKFGLRNKVDEILSNTHLEKDSQSSESQEDLFVAWESAFNEDMKLTRAMQEKVREIQAMKDHSNIAVVFPEAVNKAKDQYFHMLERKKDLDRELTELYDKLVADKDPQSIQ